MSLHTQNTQKPLSDAFRDKKLIYTYHGSEKSMLDVKHDRFWNSVASFFSTYLPWLTPNMVTLIGFAPIAILFFCYVLGFISNTYMYFWLIPTTILYVNMDAIDGKLARLTNRSSPFGQMVDHGCDAFVAGMLPILLCCTLDELNYSYLDRVTVFISVLFVYMGQMFCNIHEFYTGSMIVSMDSMGTTEVVYACSFFAFLNYVLFFFRFTKLAHVVHILSRLFTICSGVWLSYTLGSSLSNVSEDTKKKGCDTYVRRLALTDITKYFVSTCFLALVMDMSDFAVYEIVLSILYTSSFMIDIVYSNAVKSNEIVFDDIALVTLGVKSLFSCIVGTGYITMMFDGIFFAQFVSNKMIKREHILGEYTSTENKKTN